MARIRRRARRAGLDLSLSDDDVWPNSLHCKYISLQRHHSLTHYNNIHIEYVHTYKIFFFKYVYVFYKNYISLLLFFRMSFVCLYTPIIFFLFGFSPFGCECVRWVLTDRVCRSVRFWIFTRSIFIILFFFHHHHHHRRSHHHHHHYPDSFIFFFQLYGLLSNVNFESNALKNKIWTITNTRVEWFFFFSFPTLPLKFFSRILFDKSHIKNITNSSILFIVLNL